MNFFHQFEKLSERKRDILFFLSLLLFGMLFFSPSLHIPFISDEIAFIQRNSASSIKDFVYLFQKKTYDGYYYRPLGNLFSGLVTSFAGYHIEVYRLFNILLHIFNAFVLFKLTKLIFGEPKNSLMPYAASLLFLVYPGNDYAILWHTALFDRILVLFYLLALIQHIKKQRISLASLILFLLAMLSKEAAFSFPLVIAAWEYFVNDRAGNIKSALFKSSGYFLLLGLFLLLRIFLFQNNVFTAQDAHSTAGLFSILKNYFYFGGYLIFPFSPRLVQTLLVSNKIYFWLLALSGGALFVGILLKEKNDKKFWFLLFFILLTILPASRLFMRWYLYLPSTGFALCITYLVSLKVNREKLRLIILGTIFLGYSISFFQKEVLWKDISLSAERALLDLKKQTNLSSDKKFSFINIPAKVDDVPVFQLQFESLVHYYFNTDAEITVLSKSYLNRWDDEIKIDSTGAGRIVLSQIKDNYFILFENKKNANFNLEPKKTMVFTINPSANERFVYFSKGMFHLLGGHL